MTGKKLFRTSLFGYNKKDVAEQFESIINLLNEKEELIKTFGANKRDDEKEKREIADVLIRAEQTAKEIVDNAKREAEISKSDIRKSIEEEKEELQNLRNQIVTIRTQLNEHLQAIEKDMNKMYIEIK